MPESENPEPKNNSEKLTQNEKNFLEIELLKRAGAITFEAEKRWIDKNADDFSKIINEPEIIELIRENREQALKEIEKRLKEKEVGSEK